MSGLHLKGELKNKQAHLATLYKKIKELEEEIKSLEERIEAEPKSATQEKRDMEARQETRLDQDKLNALIASSSAENTEHEAPAVPIDEEIESKLLAFRE